jgi:hypothetical protein
VGNLPKWRSFRFGFDGPAIDRAQGEMINYRSSLSMKKLTRLQKKLAEVSVGLP